MARLFHSFLALLWMMISCQSSAPRLNSVVTEEIAPAATAMEQQTFNDTVVINGKFFSPCELPATVKFREYNVMYSAPQEVAVGDNGEFTFRFVPREPRQVTFRTGKTNYELFVTPKEKAYYIEITCSDGAENVEIKNSPENDAFRKFYLLNQAYNKSIEAFNGKDFSDKAIFSELQKTLRDYQDGISSIASSAKGTFTANMLCATETLPKNWLDSPEILRKNFLNREALGNPQFYNTFLSSRIVMNYTDGIRDTKDTSFAMFSSALAIAGKDYPEAAVRFQQVLHDLFYYRHQEDLLSGYIKWMDNHPDDVKNQGVKARLDIIRKSMAGNPMIDFQLNSQNGEPKKLSDVVSSSKLTLLIFYSPTCSHCQQELPELIPLWEQYKDKGLKIFAVGFDATFEEWNWFIKNKSTEEWTHAFENPDSEPSSQYAVNYTPTYILISPAGKIISRFATFDDIKGYLPLLLK